MFVYDICKLLHFLHFKRLFRTLCVPICTAVYALYKQVTQDMGLHKRANTSSMKCSQIVTTASLCPYQSLEKHAIVASKMQKQKQ